MADKGAKKVQATVRFGDLLPQVQRIAKLLPRESENSLTRLALESLIETVNAREPVLPGVAAEIIFCQMHGMLPPGRPRALTMAEAKTLFDDGCLPQDVMPAAGVGQWMTNRPPEPVEIPADPEYTPEEIARGKAKQDALRKRLADAEAARRAKSKLRPEGPPSSFGKGAKNPVDLFPPKPRSRQPRRPDQHGAG